MSEEERRKVLEMVESGVISAEQGLDLLKALQADEGVSLSAVAGLPEDLPPAGFATSKAAGQEVLVESMPPEEASFSSQKFAPGIARWRSWWWIPMWVGVGITVLSGVLMYLAFRNSGYGFWFACTWFPFLLGVAVMALAWTSRTARWLHVRINQKPGEHPQKIAISLPIPLRLTAWFLRLFRHRIPSLDNTSLDEVVLALEKTSPEAPFYVEVDEGDDGEHVEVYIG